jgi:hypothetical protein
MKRRLLGSSLLLLGASGLSALFAAVASCEALVVSPERLLFGEIAAGDSVRRVLVVTNSSDQTLAVQRMEAQAPFILSGGALSLGPGRARAVVIDFEPTESGRFEGELVLESAAFEHGTRAVQLEGSAHLPPDIGVSPRFLSFGEVCVGETARAPIAIANRGEVELEVGSLAVSRPFRAGAEFPSVAPAATGSVEVSFEPRAAGDYETSLMIQSNDPERGKVIVHVEGTGVDHAPDARIRVTPPSFDFGAVPVGGSQTKRISVRNTGDDPLAVIALRAPAPFSVPTRSRQIEPGAELSLPVTFLPVGEGGLRGTLSIYSNDPSRQVVAVGLSGESDGRALAADPRGTRDVLLDTAAVSQQGVETELAAAVPLEEAPSGELEGGEVRLGPYSEQLSRLHADSVSYDPISRSFAVSGLQLPTVDLPLGEYFHFDVTAVIGRFDGDGDAHVELPVRMYDVRGNPVDLRMPLTTLETRVNLEGTDIPLIGRPLGPDGRARLAGFARLPAHSSLGGDVMRLSLDVRVSGEAAGSDRP